VTVDQSIGAVWPEPPRSVRSNVRTYVTEIRASFRDAGEMATRLHRALAGYRLQAHPGESDLAAFDQLTGKGATAEQLRRALDLWRGEPLAGVIGSDQLDIEIAHLRERRL
jgi:DNA-binding SARP family transcriptional activator